jgi:chromate transporter
MNKWWLLFLTFLKINVLTTSGPASVGLLYTEAVGRLMTHEEFIEAVGYSSVLPGSDAIQLAVFIGYRVGGTVGALIAFVATILPPLAIMLIVAVVMARLRGAAWIEGFVKGLAPALAALLLITAFHLVEEGGWRAWQPLLLGAISLLTIAVLRVPPPVVLLAAGLLGILLYR